MPEHLAEHTGTDAIEGQDCNDMGAGGGAGQIIEGGGNEHKHTAHLAALHHGNQQNGANRQIRGGAVDMDLAHNHILNHQKSGKHRSVQAPFGVAILLHLGQMEEFSNSPIQIVRLEICGFPFGKQGSPVKPNRFGGGSASAAPGLGLSSSSLLFCHSLPHSMGVVASVGWVSEGWVSEGWVLTSVV